MSIFFDISVVVFLWQPFLLSIIHMSFYAVRVGRQPGIYTSWPECEQQVRGHPGAQYKKFPLYELAADFVCVNAQPVTTNTPSPTQGGVFYAVKVGRRPGVYHDWFDCDLQVREYPGAMFRECAT